MQENARLTPNFPWIHTRKISNFRDVSGVGKQMVNAEFSKIYRFVKLLVNEGFLAVVASPNIGCFLRLTRRFTYV